MTHRVGLARAGAATGMLWSFWTNPPGEIPWGSSMGRVVRWLPSCFGPCSWCPSWSMGALSHAGLFALFFTACILQILLPAQSSGWGSVGHGPLCVGAAGATAGCSGRAERRHMEQRARRPVGNMSLGYWPGRSLASSANTDCNQMLPGVLSLPQTVRPAGKPTLAPWTRCHGDAASPCRVGVSSAPALASGCATAQPWLPRQALQLAASWTIWGARPCPRLDGNPEEHRQRGPASLVPSHPASGHTSGGSQPPSAPRGAPSGLPVPTGGCSLPSFASALPHCFCSLALIGRAEPPSTSSTTIWCHFLTKYDAD